MNKLSPEDQKHLSKLKELLQESMLEALDAAKDSGKEPDFASGFLYGAEAASLTTFALFSRIIAETGNAAKASVEAMESTRLMHCASHLLKGEAEAQDGICSALAECMSELSLALVLKRIKDVILSKEAKPDGPSN